MGLKETREKETGNAIENSESNDQSQQAPQNERTPIEDQIIAEHRAELDDSSRTETDSQTFGITGDKPAPKAKKTRKKISKKRYNQELRHLQVELVKMQEWIRKEKLKVVVIFEGRDAAGKGGVIKRITQCLNPRYARVVALGVPTEREKSQWYFQRYVPHLPAGGEIVLFDRSWYNRAGVERVMGFCTEDEYWEFMRSCPEFERMLVRSGITLIKYWFSVSDKEQEKRFRARMEDRTKRWKLSPMDLEARSRWVEYSKAKDVMMKYTDIKQAPWYVVNADIKRNARLNCIAHLLSMIPYEDLTPDKVELPPRQENEGYIRPPFEEQTFVPEIY
jgi:polyphosphate kinase 2